MTEGGNSTFDRVRDIVADFAGLDRGRIAMESDLVEDIGIAGDDGEDLFLELDRAFEVDWTGLDLGVHFGNEGLGLPFPWHLKNNCVMYEPQPCRVSDIVRVVETGRWPGTRVIRVSRSKCIGLYVMSVLKTAFLFSVLVGGLAVILLDLAD